MPAHTLETPRPRPPAKVRRTPVKRSSTPPPAYDPTFMLPISEKGGDVTMSFMPTAFSVGSMDADALATPAPSSSDPADDLSWLNDKSRDELTELLVKADTLIKDRENELNLTSTACKVLYENNVSLKAKHETLLARLPVTPVVSSMDLFGNNSPGPLAQSPLPQRISFRKTIPETIGLSASPEDFMRSRRRPSVTTADISFLADQNAELLSKLEKLEAEANSADLAGRRELKRLEKELTFLKDELEKTQAKSNELEQQTERGIEKSIKDTLKRKEEREAKMAALKRMSRGEGASPTFLDFAPDGTLPSKSSSSHSFMGFDHPPATSEVLELGDTTIAQEADSIPQDRDLISQLLQKIQELETTNTRILEQQTETTTRLQAVQRETELMTKIYERLSESKEDDENAEAEDQLSEEPVGELNSQSLAVKISRQRSFHQHGRKSRARRSLFGTFDDSHTAAFSVMSPSNPARLPITFDNRHQSSISMNSGLVSPALSNLSLFSPPARAFDEFSPNTALLPNLANELGDDWAIDSDKHHLRGTSLSGFSQLSAPASPSQASHSTFPTDSSPYQQDEIDVPPTPQSIVHCNTLQLSVEPPTPQKNLSVARHETALIGNMSPRFRAAQSLRSRNRYTDSLGRVIVRRQSLLGLPPTPSNAPPGGRLLLDAFSVMMDEFDEQNRVVHQEDVSDFSRSPSPEVEERNDELGQDDDENRPKGKTLAGQSNEMTHSRFGSIMVEVWMWLQFAIIVLVFLWAIARRGPQSVLRDAERKRTISLKRRA